MTLACSDWLQPIVWVTNVCTGGESETHRQREREKVRVREGEGTGLDKEKVLCWASAVLSKRVPIHSTH